MPTRTKEPRRQLVVKNAVGQDVTLFLSREGTRTRVAFSTQDAPDHYAGHVSYYENAEARVLQPGIAIVLDPVQERREFTATRMENGSINVYTNWGGPVYRSGHLTFDEATAQQVAAFINAFTSFYASGAAQQNRLIGKQNKLGRRVLVGKLRTWLNPVREASDEQQRAEHGDEDVSVYVFPDSGTDTLEFESASTLQRPPFFTSANQLSARYMRNVYGYDPEVLGHGAGQLILVRPLAGFARYARDTTGNAQLTVGLYALTTDIYALMHKIHHEQQRGWRVSEAGMTDHLAVPNFPFAITLELVGGGSGTTAEVDKTAEARVEYDGKSKGMPRVRITATGVPAMPFFERKRDRYKPLVWTATLEQLGKGQWTNPAYGNGSIPMGSFSDRIRIAPADVQRILVALDARYERGLKGVGAVRAHDENILKLDSVTLRLKGKVHKNSLVRFFGAVTKDVTLSVQQGAGHWVDLVTAPAEDFAPKEGRVAAYPVVLDLSPKDVGALTVWLDQRMSLSGLGAVIGQGETPPVRGGSNSFILVSPESMHGALVEEFIRTCDLRDPKRGHRVALLIEYRPSWHYRIDATFNPRNEPYDPTVFLLKLVDEDQPHESSMQHGLEGARLSDFHTGRYTTTNWNGPELSRDPWHIQLSTEDLAAIRVWLDGLVATGAWEREEQPLSGLGSVERRTTGAIIKLPNVTVKAADGTVIDLPPFANSCVSNGSQGALRLMMVAIEHSQNNIIELKGEDLRPRHMLDEESDTNSSRIAYEQRVILALRNTMGELERELLRLHDDVDANTPVCFSDRKMVSVHEGTHATLALVYPTPSDPGERLIRDGIIKAAVKSFCDRTGPDCAKFYAELGDELQTRTEEVLTGLTGMTAAVRLSVNNPKNRVQLHRAVNLAEETAEAFASYLKPYLTIVDKVAVRESMWAAASELVRKYPSDTALMHDFIENDLNTMVQAYVRMHRKKTPRTVAGLGAVVRQKVDPRYSYITLKKVKVNPSATMRSWGERTSSRKLSFVVKREYRPSSGEYGFVLIIDDRGWYMTSITTERLRKLAAGEDVGLVNNSYTYQLQEEDRAPFAVWLDALAELGMLPEDERPLSGIVREKSKDEVLVQFDRATLMNHSGVNQNLKDLRLIKIGYFTEPKAQWFALDARVVENNELLNYLGSVTLQQMREAAQTGRLPASDITTYNGMSYGKSYVELLPSDKEQLAVYLDELEEQGKLSGAKVEG